MSAAAEDVTERTRVVEGVGRIDELGALAAEFGERVLLVTDASLVQAGHVALAERSLAEAGLTCERFAEVHADPTTDDVARCLACARAFAPEVWVALGGGSCIDVAKGANLLLGGGGTLEDYWGTHSRRAGTLLPLIAVPTTAGTGSEMQSYALIAQADSHRKMACGDPAAAPRVALLDAELTLSTPPFVTACTGLDAIAHAVESAVTRVGTPVSWRLGREALVLAARHFARVLARPDDLDARVAMLRASGLAGRAIENSMLGAAHALANPLSARYGLAHGQAVGTMLPHVVRFNVRDASVAARYAELARAAGWASAELDDAQAAEALAATLAEQLRLAQLPETLDASGVEPGALGALAEEAAAQWTAGFNPVPVGAPELEGLYRGALEARDA